MRKAVIPVLGMCMVCLVGLPATRALAASPPVDEKQALSLYFGEDELVEVATRSPMPLSQTVEDITIITAEEIAALNAHTVGEVLLRVPGFLSRSQHDDFGSATYFYGHGLSPNHVLVLMDGVRFNNTNSGQAFTAGIPLQIIKRIEIIKGPASSVWGSALAGVVNIITKDTGRVSRPTGVASASYGEGASQDYNFDLAASHLYLYAGHQESDGLRANRFFDSNRFYGKAGFDLPDNRKLSLTLGHTEPRFGWGDFADDDYRDSATNRNTFGSLNFDAPITQGVNLHLATQVFAMKYIWGRDALGLDLYYGPNSVPLFERTWDERTITFEGRLAMQKSIHSMVLGAEITRGKMDHTEDYLPAFINAGWSSQPRYIADAVEEKWGIYANDTIRLSRLTVVPGVRYDHHSITGDIVSPSLGAAMELGQETIARLYWGRGFAYPPLSFFAGTFWDGWDGVGNRNLKPEKIWVVQGGIETNAVPYLHLAASVFHYKGKDFWQYTWTNPWFWENQYDGQRDGFSLEAKTDAFHNFSLESGLTYVLKNNSSTMLDPADPVTDLILENDDILSAILGLSYNDGHFARAQLLGRYAWWDKASSGPEYEYGNFLWDFVCGFKVFSTRKMNIELFGTVHNLFNTDYYWDSYYRNPRRWVEGGVKISY